MRIGNRANEGYAEMTLMMWNPDGSAFFNYAKPAIDNNDAWHAGGLKVDIIKPAESMVAQATPKRVRPPPQPPK